MLVGASCGSLVAAALAMSSAGMPESLTSTGRLERLLLRWFATEFWFCGRMAMQQVAGWRAAGCTLTTAASLSSLKHRACASPIIIFCS